MASSSIVARDPISGSPLTVIADPNVQWSSLTNWCGVTVEQYRLREVQTPEFEMSDHVLALHVSSPASIELKIDGQRDTRIREPGDITLFPAGTPRQVRASQAHEVLVIAVAQHILARAALESRGGPRIELVQRPWLRDVQLEYIGRALKAEAESNYLSGPLYGEWLALALAAHLIREYSANQHLPPVHKGGIAPQALRRVLDYIHGNLEHQLRMGSLAEIAGLSEYRFAHNFKRATGLAPHQYVIRARIERGKQLLRETDLSVLEIAYTVGCRSSSRFNCLFRRETQATPSRYRASFR